VKADLLDRLVPPELAETLRRLRRRAYLDRALRWALLGLAGWAAAAALVMAWAKLSPTPSAGEVAGLLGVLALGAAAAGWAIGRPSFTEVARVTDARLGLKERLASALAFSGDPGEMPRRLVADAAQRASEHRPAEAYPLRSHSRRALALGASAALVAAMAFTPNPQAGALARRSADQAVIKEAKRAVMTAKKSLSHDGAGAAQAERALEQALAELQRARTPLQALAALSALEQQLASEGQNLSQLEAAAAAAGEALQGAPGAGKVARDLSTDNFSRAAADLRQLARDISKLSPAEQRELAKALEQAAKDAGAEPAGSNGSQAGQSAQGPSAQSSSATSASSLANELAAAAQALAEGRKSTASKRLGSAANGASASARAASISQELAAIEAAVRNAQSQAAAQAQADASGKGAARRGSAGPSQHGGARGASARYATGSGRGRSSGQSALTGRGTGFGRGAGSGNGSGRSKGGTGAGTGNGSANNAGAGKQPSDQVFVGGQPGANQQVVGRHLANGYKVKTTNYKAVLPAFERTALQGLGSQVVDPADQDLVKNYFSSLGK
jgi:hypothetical protein